MKKWYTIVFLFLLANNVLAQEDTAKENKIHANWPDQSEDIQLVEPGQIQFETGVSFTNFEMGEDALTVHENIRFGVADKLELGVLIQDGKQRDRYIEETVQSTYPLAVAARFSLLKDKHGLPDITLVGYLKLPFTSRSKEQSIYWSPMIIAAFENKLSDKLRLDYNAGIKQEAYGKEWAWLGTGELLYELSEKLEIYGEYFAQYQSGEQPQHNVDAGLLFTPKQNMQLSVAGGTTVFYDEPNQFVSLGFSFRLPK